MARKGEHLPRLLKSVRRSASLSLRQVEKRTGISNAYLSQLENGRTANPSPHVLAKLSRVYNVAYSDLMLAAGYPEVLPEWSPSLKLAMLTSNLDEGEQSQVEFFIEHLLARREHKDN
jgi:HTH-type transcriptional regulator, competence development regulator